MSEKSKQIALILVSQEKFPKRDMTFIEQSWQTLVVKKMVRIDQQSLIVVSYNAIK